MRKINTESYKIEGYKISIIFDKEGNVSQVITLSTGDHSPKEIDETHYEILEKISKDKQFNLGKIQRGKFALENRPHSETHHVINYPLPF